MPAARRAHVKRTLAAAGLPVIAVDSSIRLTGDDPGPGLLKFLQLASDWEAPLVRVFGGALAADSSSARREQLRAAAGVLEDAVPLAGPLGVAVGVETHDAFSPSSVVAELLALVPSDLVGAVWDSHHPHWISVEWEKRWHPDLDEPEVALPQHLDLLATWLESER